MTNGFEKYEGAHVASQYAEAGDFGRADLALLITEGDKVDLIYEIEENVWNGRSEIRLKFIDYKKQLYGYLPRVYSHFFPHFYPYLTPAY